MTEQNFPVAAAWFRRETLSGGVTWLDEPHVAAFARCNIWHVRGRDRDLLVDTGLGLASLREAAWDLFDHPVTAVLTHAHFDHIGGAFEFEDRRAHAAEAAELAEPRGFAGLTATDLGGELVGQLRAAGYDIPESLLDALPHAGFSLSGYRVPPAPARTVRDGDRLDLGDRSFEVLHLPGHSPGSIGLWEGETGILFSGDALYDGPLLFDLPGSSVEAYVPTLERLLDLPVTVVHAGHDPSFGRERLRQIAGEYLARFRA
jgi:glyoxylase-like metal-dependent hydrolase (beta-lactamase superfamily II)